MRFHSSPLCWRVDACFDLEETGRELPPALGLVPDRLRQIEWVLVDDHDWALWAGGMALLVSRNEARLVRREGDGLSVAVGGIPRWPLLPASLPESDLRTAVLHCSQRPLRCRTVRHGTQQGVVLRDAMEKILVRGRLEIWGTDGELRLFPLRGYGDEARRVGSLLDRLAPRCLPGSALFASLEADGFRPQIPELDVQLRDGPDLGASLRDGISRLLANCWHNEEGVVEDLDPECLHHYRVSLRRARVLVAAARELAEELPVAELARHLHAIAERTGALRDLDVHLAKRPFYESLLPATAGSDFVAGFMESLGADRRRQLGVLRRYLRSAAHARRRECLAALLVPERWPALSFATRGFLADRMHHRLARLARTAREIPPAATDELLHRVRVQVKKLRYLAASCRDILESAQWVPWMKRLASLQGVFGEIHDLAVGRDRLSAYQTQRDGNAQSEATAAIQHAIGAQLASSKARAIRQLGAFLHGRRQPGPLPLLTEENRDS